MVSLNTPLEEITWAEWCEILGDYDASAVLDDDEFDAYYKRYQEELDYLTERLSEQ